MKKPDGRGRDILQGLVAAGKPNPPSEASVHPARASGAVRAMSLGLDRLTAEAAQAKALREELASRETTQELDPALFSQSIVSDRIPSTTDTRFQELKAAIAENGQQIPIIARPHPTDDGHYQIAAGHRRWRVAQELGLQSKLEVRNGHFTRCATAGGYPAGSPERAGMPRDRASRGGRSALSSEASGAPATFAPA